MNNPVVQVILNMVYKGLEHFGRYYSEYRGYVVDNEDPKGMNRVQLVVPGIIDNPSDEWYFGSNQFSGNNYGCQVLPQRGDLVFVSFEMGDPHKPIWKLGHFGESEIPEERRDPNIYWFRTPKGLMVELDDTKEEVRVTDTHKNVIYLTSKGISFETPNQIFLGGKEKSNDSVASGNSTTEILTEHQASITTALGSIKSLSTNLTDLMTTMASAAAPPLLVAQLGARVPGLVKNLKEQAVITEASNKSISSITNKLSKVNSNKIKINE